MSQLSASQGCTLKWSSRVSRSSKIRLPTRSDCASRPTRGSRFVGLLSMIMTTVSESGRRAQEVANNRQSRAAQKTRLVRREINASAQSTGPEPLDIGDFAQNSRSHGSGCGGDIAGKMTPGLIREYGKCHSFLGFGGQSEFIALAETNLQGLELFRKHPHEGGIERAAAGDDQ